MINKLIGATFVAAMMASTAMAADVKPALVYGTGGKFDKSFNEASYAGAEKFKAETGIEYRDFEPTGDTRLASRRVTPALRRRGGPLPRSDRIQCSPTR